MQVCKTIFISNFEYLFIIFWMIHSFFLKKYSYLCSGNHKNDASDSIFASFALLDEHEIWIAKD